MSKYLLSQREIAVIKHVWSLNETEAAWLDKYKLMRSTVGVLRELQDLGKLNLEDILYKLVWTNDDREANFGDPVLLSFRAHYNSKTQVVLCHVIKSQLSCKAIELPEYES